MAWNIQQFPHLVTVSGNLEVDGGMSVIADPFDTASMTLDIGGALIVTNSGGGIGGSDVITSSRTGSNSITLNGFNSTLTASSFHFA